MITSRFNSGLFLLQYMKGFKCYLCRVDLAKWCGPGFRLNLSNRLENGSVSNVLCCNLHHDLLTWSSCWSGLLPVKCA